LCLARKEIIGVVIVAAGASRRMRRDKVLEPLAGKPLLLHALAPFFADRRIGPVVLVLNRRNLRAARAVLERVGLLERVRTCLGGERRQDSTFAGVRKLGRFDWVIVHDGARPLVTREIIDRGLEAMRETGVATAAVPVTDTIKLGGGGDIVERTVPRESLWQTQTPQVFSREAITAAFEHNATDVTDDTQLAGLAGYKVKLFMGAYDNIKITTPADLGIAAALLAQRLK
jgi:2-C-methyl-D-erythritol 4-phosphate cytidylyltransferase